MPTYVNESEMLPKLTGHWGHSGHSGHLGNSGHSSDMQDLRHQLGTIKVRVCHANANARSISFVCLQLFHECSVSFVQMLQTVNYLPRRTSQNCGSLWPISGARASPGNGRNLVDILSSNHRARCSP